MPKLVYWCRLASRVLIGALLSTHVAFAMPPCCEPAPPSAAVAGQHADEDCLAAAAAAAEPSRCALSYAEIDQTPGPVGPNVPPAAAAGALLLPVAPAGSGAAAYHRGSADAIPRLSKSLLFCSWLS